MSKIGREVVEIIDCDCRKKNLAWYTVRRTTSRKRYSYDRFL